MSQFYRIYKDFYNFNYTSTGNTNTLIDPVFLSANTYGVVSGNTYNPNAIIEQNVGITQEQTGVYRVDLNPILYSIDQTYTVVWFVTYLGTPDETPTPLKLFSQFRLNYIAVSNEIEIEMLGYYPTH